MLRKWLKKRRIRSKIREIRNEIAKLTMWPGLEDSEKAKVILDLLRKIRELESEIEPVKDQLPAKEF